MDTPPAATTTLDSIRKAIGSRYELERELGRGGMGVVYLARELKLDRPVALKILLPEFVAQTGLRDRFLLETRTAASFSHPNIVPVYAVEDADDYLAYSMGMVEGETLKQRVERAGPLPTRELVRMMQEVAYALAYAHGRGVVHRDIKPENVMLERATGRALVLDFGISRSMTQPVTASSLTRVGEIVGTPEYMSPEQVSGDSVDGRSDLYALGLTAHFAATGRPAVTGENTQKILVRQLTEPVAPIAQLRPDLPIELAAVIDRCVRKDPEERFQTAEALVDEIDAAQLAEPDIPVPIRLFAGELSTLSIIVFGLMIMLALFVRNQMQARMSVLDILVGVVLLLAVIVTRTLSTIGESRRLARSGFSTDDVHEGLVRVMKERAQHRRELHDLPQQRRHRRQTFAWGAAILFAGIVMMRIALSMRIRLGPTQYAVGPGTTIMIYAAVAMVGTSAVLLLKSPFRMPVGEMLFRVIWLSPLGCGFLWLSSRSAYTKPGVASASTRPRNSPRAPMQRNVTVQPAPASAQQELLAPAMDAASDPLLVLEARVRELERQFQQRS